MLLSNLAEIYVILKISQKMKALLLVVSVCWFAGLVLGRKDTAALCGACKAVVDELSYEVKKVDPKKTIQVSISYIISQPRVSMRVWKVGGEREGIFHPFPPPTFHTRMLTRGKIRLARETNYI